MMSLFKCPIKICVMLLILFLAVVNWFPLSINAATTIANDNTILEGVYKLKNVSTGKYMQTHGTSNGSGVVLNSGNNSTSQKFIIRPSGIGENEYYILPMSSIGISLDIDSARSGNIQVEVYRHLYYTPLNYTNQVFKIEKVNSNYYSIKTKCGENNCITAEAATSLVMQNTFSNETIDYWCFEKIGIAPNDIREGIYQLRNANTGKYMEVQNGGSTNGSKLIQAIQSSSNYQKFYVKPIGTNEYCLLPVHITTKAVDIPNWNQGIVQAEIYSYYATSNPNNQTFRIEKVNSSGYYSIKTKHTVGNPNSGFSNSCLTVDTTTNAIMQNVYTSQTNLNHWIFEPFVPFDEGVYSLQSIYNTNLYIDVPWCSTDRVSLRQWEYGNNPKEDSDRAGLFKFIRQSDNIYKIYPMANNLNTLITNGNELISENSNDYTWRVTFDTDGNILLSSANDEYGNLYICTNSNNTSGDLINMLDVTTFLNPQSIESSNCARWKLSEYTGTMEGVYVKAKDSHIIDMGTSIDLSSFAIPNGFYSTIIGKNSPGTASFSVSDISGHSTSIATISSAGVLSTVAQKIGVVKVTVNYSSGVSFSTNIYIKPLNLQYSFIQNIQGQTGFIQQDGTIANKDELTYNDEQIWQWIPYNSEWYTIKNISTGQYLRSPSNGTIGANISLSIGTTYDSTYLWKHSNAPSNSGGKRIQSKYMVDNHPSLCLSVNSVTGTLEQGTYINNSSFYDEFNVITIGEDVVYNRTFTWITSIDPSEVISNLSPYYSSYTLIHPDIYMNESNAREYLENSKIVVFNGHGSPSVITIHEYPRLYLSNSQIYNKNNATQSMDLSSIDIVFFAGCSTGGNPCDYCDKKGKHEGHYAECPSYGSALYNMPKSAQYAGAKVAIGWSKTIWDNHINDWIERFIFYMNTINSTTNKLYTAYEAYNKTNAEITTGGADSAVIYGTNINFRLSD